MASSSSSLLPSSPLPSSSASPPDSPQLELPAPSPPTFPHFGSPVPIILWDVQTDTCRTFEKTSPKYIILSHSYEDGTDNSRLEFITHVAKMHGIRYVWLDSHCMGETQDEVSRSVESMFKYYQGAEFCCLWLGTSDMKDGPSDHPCFNESWLLQDLLASTRVKVYSRERSFIGQITKMTLLANRASPADDFLHRMANSTRLPLAALSHPWPETHFAFTVAQKMSWAAERETRRAEDKAYALFGILDVKIPVTYPDQNAFRRLQQSIVSRHQKDQSIFAWGLNMSSKSNTGGLWADSPDDFARCNSVMFKEVVEEPVMQVTHQNTLFLVASLIWSGLPSQHYVHALINCGVPAFGGELACIGIPLCQNGDTTFRRAGIAAKPLPLSFRRYHPYLHSIKIAPDVCPHGRRFSLAFDPRLRGVHDISVTMDPALGYWHVRDRQNARIWHFESHKHLEAPTEEEFLIKIGTSSEPVDLVAKMELSWSLRSGHWEIGAWQAALARGDSKNYWKRIIYGGSVLRVWQRGSGIFCIAKD